MKTSKLHIALDNPNKGANQEVFTLVFENDNFKFNDVVTWNLMFGDSICIVSHPKPYETSYFAYKATLVGSHITPKNTVDERGFTPGTEYELINQAIGEYDIPN